MKLSGCGRLCSGGLLLLALSVLAGWEHTEGFSRLLHTQEGLPVQVVLGISCLQLMLVHFASSGLSTDRESPCLWGEEQPVPAAAAALSGC